MEGGERERVEGRGREREGGREREREREGREREGRGREGGREGEMVDHHFFLAHIRVAPAPIIGFDSSSDTNLFLREGESVELCVMLMSGSIPSEFTFDVVIFREFEQPRGKVWLLVL